MFLQKGSKFLYSNNAVRHPSNSKARVSGIEITSTKNTQNAGAPCWCTPAGSAASSVTLQKSAGVKQVVYTQPRRYTCIYIYIRYIYYIDEYTEQRTLWCRLLERPENTKKCAVGCEGTVSLQLKVTVSNFLGVQNPKASWSDCRHCEGKGGWLTCLVIEQYYFGLI